MRKTHFVLGTVSVAAAAFTAGRATALEPDDRKFRPEVRVTAYPERNSLSLNFDSAGVVVYIDELNGKDIEDGTLTYSIDGPRDSTMTTAALSIKPEPR